jgi:hypothetical protein
MLTLLLAGYHLTTNFTSGWANICWTVQVQTFLDSSLPWLIAFILPPDSVDNETSNLWKWKLRYNQWSVRQSVLVPSTHLQLMTRFLFLPDSCAFFFIWGTLWLLMWGDLWREDWCVVYNRYWSSSVQSFSGPILTGLATIFYCLEFETPLSWMVRILYLYPPKTWWPSYTHRYWINCY